MTPITEKLQRPYHGLALISHAILGFLQSGYAWEMGRCSVGDSGIKPYIIGHHTLLAHAAAIKLYRDKYQVSFPNRAIA